MQFISGKNKSITVLVAMLSTMLLAGIWSFILGSASLKGVNTLDINPGQKINKNNGSLNNMPKDFAPYPEEKILKAVRVYVAEQKEINQKKTK